jgi:WYL_2, Sm-like SH3 beta-barrel fold
MNTLTESTLNNLLAGGVVKVTFRKVDGDVRVMDCTKKLDIIPISSWPKTDKQLETNGMVRAYDVNANGWRSFYFANVIEASTK